MKGKILIIGGGLTGMSAGIFGRLAGFETHVFEAHTLVGGVCTGWKRSGYTFDGCFHWWVGSIPDSPFYKYFEKIGIFPDTRPIRHELFTRIDREGQKPFTVWNDAARLKKEMLDLAPEDKEAINLFFDMVNRVGNVNMPMDKPMEAYTMKDWMAFGKMMGPEGKIIPRLMKTPISDWAGRFRNGSLREIFSMILPGDSPVFTLMMFIGMFDRGDGTFPEGGAPLFMQRVETRYRELGGELSTGTRVKKVLVEKGRAVGIEMEDGTIQRGDHVISAADGHSTLYGMLGGKYLSPKIKKIYKTAAVFKPLVMVYFGIDADLSGQPHSIVRSLDTSVAGIPVKGLSLKHYAFDKSLAPAGKTAAGVMFATEYEPWEKLKAAGKPYAEAKEAYAELARRYFEETFPEARGKIEVTDVSTPMTFVRYTSAWRGSFEGWQPTVKNFSTRIPKTLPGLKNFRMAGQWVEPGGGIPSAVKSGHDAIWMISNGKG
jgi:phytoene dehydrogenase-like protein